MTDNPLKSLTNYSRFVTGLLNRASVQRTTVAVWSDSRYTGVAEGEVFFFNGIRLRLREELDFDAKLSRLVAMNAFTFSATSESEK